MSDIDALAEGLHAIWDKDGSLGCPHKDDGYGVCQDFAADLAATPPVAALLADAAVGRAVRAAVDALGPDPDIRLTFDSGDEEAIRWCAWLNDGAFVNYGPTIAAAIKAALGDET